MQRNELPKRVFCISSVFGFLTVGLGPIAHLPSITIITIRRVQHSELYRLTDSAWLTLSCRLSNTRAVSLRCSFVALTVLLICTADMHNFV